MPLAKDEVALVHRIVARLQSPNDSTFRSGGRAVALQAIEHRGDLVRALRSELTELGEHLPDERRRGYQEALLDLLTAAEAAIEPRESEQRARAALASSVQLQNVLDQLVDSGGTPGEIAKLAGKSSATGTRYFRELRKLGLISELPGRVDGRERPHRVTPLGARLARPVPPPVRKPHFIPSEQLRRTLEALSRAAQQELDPLTGMFLLPTFQEMLKSQLSLYHRAGEALSLMRVDIAGFSEVAGDLVLAHNLVRLVASKLKEELEPPSMFARYEPDKFLVMLPCRADETAERVKALRSRLDPIVASIGIASATTDPVDVDTLLSESSEALARAKAAGQGRFVTLSAGTVAATG